MGMNMMNMNVNMFGKTRHQRKTYRQRCPRQRQRHTILVFILAILYILLMSISIFHSLWIGLIFSSLSSSSSSSYPYDHSLSTFISNFTTWPSTSTLRNWEETTRNQYNDKFNHNDKQHLTSSTAMTTTTTTTTTTQTPTTLALIFPPGLVGGYRNQVLRLIGFLQHARHIQATQLLLPTLLFTTTYRDAKDDRKFYPIPMSYLFDIDHWNTFFHHHDHDVDVDVDDNHNHNYSPPGLPLLVHSIPDGDCWQNHPFDSPYSNSDHVDDQSFSNKDDKDNFPQTETTSFLSPMAFELTQSPTFVSPLRNLSHGILLGQITNNTRKWDVSNLVEHCRHPRVYGGGRGAGKLWNDVMKTFKRAKQMSTNTNTNRTTSPTSTSSTTKTMMTPSTPRIESNENISYENALLSDNLFALVSQALIPKPEWREVARQCIVTNGRGRRRRRRNIHSDSNVNVNVNAENHNATTIPYIALHARVEVDMMIHRCSRNMERNLTKIFDMVEDFQLTAQYNNNSRRKKKIDERINHIFVAVSRQGMQHPTKEEWVQETLKENWKTLNSVQERSASHFVECGELMMNQWYRQQSQQEERNETSHSHHQIIKGDDYYGSILPSMLNFYLATEATIFVGVEKSSWSTDVWATRYHQGKGHLNYHYTPNGIFPVPNGGLPLPHGNC